MSGDSLAQAPIRSWGLTTYSRRDYDSRRPTGGTRVGRWHAFQDSNDPMHQGRAGSVTLLALCGRWVDIGIQDWHNGEDPPTWPLETYGALGYDRRWNRRHTCQDCLRRQVEGGQ